VTGGCGFIRQHLVRQLVERGDDVRVLDRRDGRYLPSGVDFVRGSILDGTRLRDACRGVDRVFHLAANPRLWARDKGEFERVNLHGTEAVLAEAERVGVARVVYTSTESILRGRSENEEAATTESVKTSPDDLPGPYAGPSSLPNKPPCAPPNAGNLSSSSIRRSPSGRAIGG